MYRQIQDATPTDEIAQTIAGITLEIERMNAELEKLKREKFLDVLSGLQKVSSALGGLEGEIGEIFTELSAQIGNISTAFDKTAGITDQVSAGISGIVSMINVAHRPPQSGIGWRKSTIRIKLPWLTNMPSP